MKQTGPTQTIAIMYANERKRAEIAEEQRDLLSKRLADMTADRDDWKRKYQTSTSGIVSAVVRFFVRGVK